MMFISCIDTSCISIKDKAKLIDFNTNYENVGLDACIINENNNTTSIMIRLINKSDNCIYSVPNMINYKLEKSKQSGFLWEAGLSGSGKHFRKIYNDDEIIIIPPNHYYSENIEVTENWNEIELKYPYLTDRNYFEYDDRYKLTKWVKTALKR